MIPLPSPDEQKEISEPLTAHDAETLNHRRKNAALFRALLHELMTAKARVHSIALNL